MDWENYGKIILMNKNVKNILVVIVKIAWINISDIAL